jgi:hypothetical protein
MKYLVDSESSLIFASLFKGNLINVKDFITCHGFVS